MHRAVENRSAVSTIVTEPVGAGPLLLITRWRNLRPIEALCYATGAELVVAGLLHLVVLAVDGGP